MDTAISRLKFEAGNDNLPFKALTGRFDVVNIKLDKPTGLIRTNNFVVEWKGPI